MEAGQESDDGREIVVAGRILLRRVFGKLAFFTLQDDSGTIQLYCEKKKLEEGMGEGSFKQMKAFMDTGDIVTAKGSAKRTDKGELSVNISEFTVLTKSLLPLPDKFHGLTDVEKRYRQRHLDLIVNTESKDTFRKRSKIISLIRRYLEDRDFVEVETPVFHSQAGGAEVKRRTDPCRIVLASFLLVFACTCFRPWWKKLWSFFIKSDRHQAHFCSFFSRGKRAVDTQTYCSLVA